MRISILHNQPQAQGGADDQDVLVQVAVVQQALEALGHESVTVACTLDLAEMIRELRASSCELVFNLVEALGGTDRLCVLVPYVLEAERIRYTGCPLEAMLLANGKLTAKDHLRRGGIPTPDWISTRPAHDLDLLLNATRTIHGDVHETPWIMKAEWEHASFQMRNDAVGSFAVIDDIREQLAKREAQFGRKFFAERFIDGREFNVGLLGQGQGRNPQVLPLAEIDFSKFPTDQPRIVGFDAKWNEDSIAFQQTPRVFPQEPGDQTLLCQLREIATKVWKLFGLRGFARIDFRVDMNQRPWVLEVNTNPCLSPDAGFQAALEQAKITLADAVSQILTDCE